MNATGAIARCSKNEGRPPKGDGRHKTLKTGITNLFDSPSVRRGVQRGSDGTQVELTEAEVERIAISALEHVGRDRGTTASADHTPGGVLQTQEGTATEQATALVRLAVGDLIAAF